MAFKKVRRNLQEFKVKVYSPKRGYGSRYNRSKFKNSHVLTGEYQENT